MSPGELIVSESCTGRNDRERVPVNDPAALAPGSKRGPMIFDCRPPRKYRGALEGLLAMRRRARIGRGKPRRAQSKRSLQSDTDSAHRSDTRIGGGTCALRALR